MTNTQSFLIAFLVGANLACSGLQLVISAARPTSDECLALMIKHEFHRSQP
jgi:hypothetical protein